MLDLKPLKMLIMKVPTVPIRRCRLGEHSTYPPSLYKLNGIQKGREMGDITKMRTNLQRRNTGKAIKMKLLLDSSFII